jgi:hypothetical protein
MLEDAKQRFDRGAFMGLAGAAAAFSLGAALPAAGANADADSPATDFTRWL